MDLYRQEVIEARRPRLQGEVLLLPRIHHLWLTLAVVLWLLVTALFLIQASYSKRETVRGFLQPTAGVVRIYPQDDGQLVQLLVSEGDRVEPGQTLAVVNGDRVMADGAHLQKLLLEKYREQQSTLEAELKRSSDLSETRGSDLQKRIGATRRELALLDSQLETRQLQIDLEADRIKRYEALQSGGHITESELELLRAQQLDKKLAQQELEASRERLQTQYQQLLSEDGALPQQEATENYQIHLQLSTLSQQIARLESDSSHVIESVSAGTVANIHLKPGQKAHKQLPLLTLLPEGSRLVATLLVPIRAAGFVEAGQTLHLRYDAFPYQSFGSYTGRITAVSPTVSLPGERLHQPLEPAEPVYRVTASLEQHAVTGHGREVPLKAGMTFAADIKLRERNLLQWLLEPVYTIRGRMQ